MFVKYLWQLIRHKWFVFLAACKLGIPWLGVVHDWSKFLPSEFVPYARFFYGGYPERAEAQRQCPGYSGPTKLSTKRAFNVAWNHHQKRNRHHWQYWMLTNNSDEPQTICLDMPRKYRKEMLADWQGAGRAYGNPDTAGWYKEHYDKIKVNGLVRIWLAYQLGVQ